MTAPSPRTLLGPLTTTWTQPVGCLYGVASACATCTTVWLGQMCNMDALIYDATDCWPPRPTDFNSDPGVMMGWGFYSPGIHCPAGYSTAAMATSGGLMGWDVEYLMTAGETAAACCPTGYSISDIQTLGTSAQTCVTTATAGSFSTAHCAAGRYTDVSEARVPQTVSGVVQSRFVLFAPLFQLNFRSADVTAAASTSASASRTASPGSSSTTSVLPGAIPGDGAAGGPDESAAPQQGGGLTQAQKAGIGIGIAAAAVAAGFLLFFLFRRIRRQKTAAAGKLPDSEKNGGAAPVPPPTASEADGQEVKELEAVSKPQEAAAPVPTELPTATAKGERASRETQANVYELPADNPSTAGRPWLG